MATELRKRGTVLAEKQRLIGATIGMTRAKLEGLEIGAYFDMILKLAVRSAQPGKGELLLSKKDLERLPEGFGDRLNASLKDRETVLHISEDIRDIDGDLVFTYGRIEENCSADVPFNATYEVLQDRVQEILFL